LGNSQLVLNILSLNAALPLENDIKPSLSTLSTIHETVSAGPSCSNLNDFVKDSIDIDRDQPWCIYENDEESSKSTDALLDDGNICGKNTERSCFPTSLSYSLIKESQTKSNINYSSEGTEKSSFNRIRSGSKTPSKDYTPVSTESLSQGYVDDFDESCALITQENGSGSGRKKNSSHNDLIPKRNNLSVSKTPQTHRFSAGDADKLEKGIKKLASTTSLRSMRDS
jgi:hypothetical protein